MFKRNIKSLPQVRLLIKNIKKITKDNFSEFGDFINPYDKIGENINSNTTKSYFDLANIEILKFEDSNTGDGKGKGLSGLIVSDLLEEEY